jgi:tetratricopeptide (TPR) repeat protein
MPVSSDNDPVADLILELSAPFFHQDDTGLRRAAASATLVYEPPQGSRGRSFKSRPFQLIAPLGPIEKYEIDRYLESYHRWTNPVFQDQARDVERRLPEWGQLIYDALAKPDEARKPLAAWELAPEDTSRRFTVLVDESSEGEAAEAATHLLALPWELAHDGRAYLFQGGNGARVRRRLHGHSFARTGVTEAPIRVLLVSPRPEDEQTDFIDHRVSARPLLDAFDELGSLAELTLLTPPTLKALDKELREAKRGKRPYHVVHFDGHGVYDRKHGLGALCFEDPADEKKLTKRRHKLVPADEVSAILRDYGISLVFLEACQSATAEDDPTSSVASRLLQDGVSSVVAMSHTVLVETARRFVGAFYGELVRGSRIGEAMLAGQRELKNDDFRYRVFKGELRLQDWFVPILFQEADDPALVEAVLKEGEGEDRKETLRLAVGKIPEEPDHTFVGRSRELLAAERLLARERYVVLRGEGGEGKTTLAAELVRWLVRTRRFERAAFVSLEHAFDERAVLWTLGDQLVDGFASEAGQDEERARKLLRASLAATPTILLFDNMETALASEDLIDKVLALAQELMRQGETRLVFTTREPLPAPFARHLLDISRLGRVDAVALVARVLGREDAVPYVGDEGESEDEIVELVDAVRGHARSLVLLAQEVAVAGVRRTTSDLRGVLEGLHERYGDDRERSLFASVELSLRRLPAGMRERIRPLAVFHGGGHLSVIAMVLGLDMDKNEHSDVTQAIVGVGLGELLSYGHLRLHPALGPALDRELSDEERSEACRAWVEAMVQLVAFLRQQRSKDVQTAATLTVLELPNLLAVLEHLRRDASAETMVDVATSLEGLLESLGRPKALARVVRVREEASKGLGEWSHAQFQAADATVDRLWEAGRFAEAVEAARRVLKRCQTAREDAYAVAPYDVAMAHAKLGRTLRLIGAAEAALTSLAEARTRFEKLGEAGDEDAAKMASGCVTETGDCLQALGRLTEAARAYETSIKLHERLGDRRWVAVAKAQLGAVRIVALATTRQIQ